MGEFIEGHREKERQTELLFLLWKEASKKQMNKYVYVCNDIMSNDMNESVLIVMRRLLVVL